MAAMIERPRTDVAQPITATSVAKPALKQAMQILRMIPGVLWRLLRLLYWTSIIFFWLMKAAFKAMQILREARRSALEERQRKAALKAEPSGKADTEQRAEQQPATPEIQPTAQAQQREEARQESTARSEEEWVQEADAQVEDPAPSEAEPEAEAMEEVVFESMVVARDADDDTVAERCDKDASPRRMVLRRLRLHAPSSVAAVAVDSALRHAVAEARQSHVDDGVRFSFQDVHDDENQQGARERQPRVAVLGPRSAVWTACDTLKGFCCQALGADVELKQESCSETIFALQFTLRAADDIPHDEELLDASLEKDWVDLGECVSVDAQESAACASSPKRPPNRTPEVVTKLRLQKVTPSEKFDLDIFMDDMAEEGGVTQVDLVGSLEHGSQPIAWDAATRTVLSCEARGVYLSRTYDLLFWHLPKALQQPIEDQVACALTHWKGALASGADAHLCSGAGCGATAIDFGSFEDMAANVSAVLRREQPPGWHRLEWTPHGADAVPHVTY